MKSLGVTFDSHLSFDKHINSICRACYFHIRGLRHVRPAMSTDTTKIVACAIVSSRLDYCNVLLAGMPQSNLDDLQHVQNTLARVVTGLRRRDHTTPALKELHWLPIQAICYRLIICKTINLNIGINFLFKFTIPTFPEIRDFLINKM